MARFIDLDESDDDASHSDPQAYARRIIAATRVPSHPPIEAHENYTTSDSNEARNAGFAAALTCYPCVIHAIN